MQLSWKGWVKLMVAVFVSLSLLVSGMAVADDWTMDPANSRLEFIVGYTGSDMPGTFRDFSSVLTLDPENPGAGRLVVTVDVASADMGSDDVNEIVAGIVWLDVAAFTTATFISDDISMRGPGEFTATGILELKGVRCAVAVPFNWSDDGRRASMQGELTLQRLDFGIGIGSWEATDEVPADVRVRFDVAFIKAD